MYEGHQPRQSAKPVTAANHHIIIYWQWPGIVEAWKSEAYQKMEKLKQKNIEAQR
jgi:hypothetical protein